MREIEDVLKRLPAVPDKPIEDMNTAEQLNANVREGLIQCHRILSQKMKLKMTDEDELSMADLRLQRVIAETAGAQAKLLAHVQQAALQHNRKDDLSGILEALLKTEV